MYNAGLSVEVYILHRKSKAWTVFIFAAESESYSLFWDCILQLSKKNALRPIKQKK